MADPQADASAGRASDGGSPRVRVDTPAGSVSIDGLRYDEGIAAPIAICGMALRLPGGLSTPQQLWQFLLDKGDARCRVPESRYNVSAFHATTGKPGSVATEYGYFLDDSVDLGALDTSFFTMPKTEVQRADPQQRMLFEVARECFDDAGVINWRGKTIGCYVGSFGEDWVDMFAKDEQPWGVYCVTGYGDFALSNRLSYEMDLRGPSITLRTACSSALTCLNEACMAISRGDCESALVGGVNLIMSPTMTMAMTEQGVLSPDGSCKTFSAEANGYARGEGITAIFIKPLRDAIRDGNPIRAVIRGTSANVDGKTPGLSQPSTDAQEALIRRAYQVAGIRDLGSTAVVECHGTGTSTGDPIEAKAVARVFGERGVYITSVKPNLGHAEGASGLVSVIKMVLSLEHRTIPPNIKFGTPNPNIPFASSNLTVPVEPTTWPEDRAERASVNSFGIGGANAHAIIDSAASFDISSLANTPFLSPQLLLFSANTANSLQKMVVGYEEWLGKHPESVGNLAYTLAHRREQMPHRSFIVVNNGIMGKASIPAKAVVKPNIVMVFTGQGAHWPQMGRELLQSNMDFRTSIRTLDKHLQAIAAPEVQVPYSIEEELLRPPRKSKMNEAALSQPLCTAIQVALVDTYSSLGIVPDAVVGHSSGEIAAAYAAGALTAKEAIIAAHHRGAVAMRQKKAGAMAAIGMSWSDTETYLANASNVTIACDNSPSSVTISGDASAVKGTVAFIKESRPGVLARLLVVDKAYHSQHMAEIGDDYLALIDAEVRGVRPIIPFFSSVTGKLLDPGRTLGSQYWKENLTSPVRFREAVTNILYQDVGKNALFLEVGPHSALAGPLRQICTSAPSPSPAPYVSALTRNQDCVVSFLSSLGKLHSLNAPVNLQSLIPRGRCLPDPPRYPWDHTGSYWFETRLCKEWRQRQYAYHDLLGSRVASSTKIEPVWRNVFHLRNAPWVADHKVKDDIVFPIAGYMALAGEAIRQITGVNEGYRIRNIDVSMALVVPEGKPTEIITTFRPCRLTRSLNSQWWEFTVASYNNNSWQRHCAGEVSVISARQLGGAWKPPVLPRKLVPQRWYEAMYKRGLCLGPSFQTLRNIETATISTNEASATISNVKNGDEANYHIHPTVIDGVLQLLGASAVHGIARRLKHWLPTKIDEFSVVRCCSDLATLVSAMETSNSSLVGKGRCVSTEASTVLEASGIHLTPVNSDDGILDAHSAARYAWGNNIEFMNAADLIRPAVESTKTLGLLEDLARLCLHSASKSLSASTTIHPSMLKYASWIRAQHQDTLKSTTRSIFTVKELTNRLSETSAAPVASALVQMTNKLDFLLSGQTLESVVSQETMAALHSFITEGQMDLQDFIQTLGHSKPNLRVLELGIGGRPSQFKNILKNLKIVDGNVLCSKYTIASPSFIIDKTKNEGFANMEYVSLDISRDLEEQSFEGRQYDLIIATHILHRTDNLQRSLVNIRKLLSPQGRLLLQELRPSSTSTWVKYIFGSQLGLRDSDCDDLPTEPWLTVGSWEAELLTAGFNGIRGLVKSSEDETHLGLTTMIVAEPVVDQAGLKQVTILYDSDQGYRDLFAKKFEEAGYEVSTCKLGDQPIPGHHIVSLLDADGPFFDNMNSDSFRKLKAFLGSLGASRILWVTLPCQRVCRDPRYAQVLGFARTMRSEMLIDFATCEVEFATDPSAEQVVRVFSEFQRQHGEGMVGSLKPDFEYLIENGQIKTGRFYPFILGNELLTSQPDDRASLRVSTPGNINTLHWAWHPREEPVSDEVEIEVHHAGLNFRDILVATGVIELPGTSRRFGLEAAGVVTRAGPQVKGIKIGDRVVCLSLQKQALTTHITVADFAVAKIPNTLSFEEAATMLVPFVTAIHSLIRIGGLATGQSVLIHSACGGVGLAAVQIAQMLGAEVFATVGKDDKVQFLMDNFHLPRERILFSRDNSFADDLMRETKGKGVDVVLNSLSGKLLHATWSIVAEFGKMIEIGKRDLIGGGKLDMQPFLANRTYSCVDIDELWKRPAVLQGLIISTLEFYDQNCISPIGPIRTYSINETLDVIRYMQKGDHIGRIGISIRDSNGGRRLAFDAVERNREVSLSSAGSYLLVGGLGGLGRAITIWMVELGARELVFLSRNAGTDPRDEAFVTELISMGCSVKLLKGDVTKSKDVAGAIAATTALKGVIQMSMVLRDQNFEAMNFDEWTAAVSPKVQGTWNLHNATNSIGIKLDFFILFSSLSGLVGQPGQANYASANAFLDAFARFRAGLGLAASVIDIGAMEDIGYISQNPGLMHKMKATGFRGLTEQQLLDALVVAMSPIEATSKPRQLSPACSFTEANAFALGLGSTMPLHSSTSRIVWRNDRRMAAYHNGGAGAAAGAAAGQSNETLKVFLNSARADPAVLTTPEASKLLAVEIGKNLFDILLKPHEDLNMGCSLVDLGLDSLVAIELRTWWKQVFSLDISVLEMLGMGSLDGLGQHAIEGLRGLYDVDDGGGKNMES